MIKQREIITTLKVKPMINVQKEIRRILEFIKLYLKNNFLESLIVGISGGQDSTLTGKLCQMAIEELRQETDSKNYRFIALRLPYGKQRDEQDCQDAIKFIKPDNLFSIDIKESVLSSEKSLNLAGIYISDYVRGNMKARERMKIQYSIANIYNGLVVGSNNASEIVTGYYTKYGDGGCDISPICHLNKQQGRQMLENLYCPKHLYLKQPTADLSDNKPGLKDEEELNLSYNIIDSYLEGRAVTKKTSAIIENLYYKNTHKRQLPAIISDIL